MLLLCAVSLQADADSFYTACNGRPFNSIEDAVCQLVYVERAEVIKSEEVRLAFDPEYQVPSCLISGFSSVSFPPRPQGASLPVMELTELPKCTVCLERMDESVNGVLTTLCNHSFHSQCLQSWQDTS